MKIERQACLERIRRGLRGSLRIVERYPEVFGAAIGTAVGFAGIGYCQLQEYLHPEIFSTMRENWRNYYLFTSNHATPILLLDHARESVVAMAAVGTVVGNRTGRVHSW